MSDLLENITELEKQKPVIQLELDQNGRVLIPLLREHNKLALEVASLEQELKEQQQNSSSAEDYTTKILACLSKEAIGRSTSYKDSINLRNIRRLPSCGRIERHDIARIIEAYLGEKKCSLLVIPNSNALAHSKFPNEIILNLAHPRTKDMFYKDSANEDPQKTLKLPSVPEGSGFLGYAVNCIFLSNEQLKAESNERKTLWYSLLQDAMIFETRDQLLQHNQRHPEKKNALLSLDGFIMNPDGTTSFHTLLETSVFPALENGERTKLNTNGVPVTLDPQLRKYLEESRNARQARIDIQNTQESLSKKQTQMNKYNEKIKELQRVVGGEWLVISSIYFHFCFYLFL